MYFKRLINGAIKELIKLWKLKKLIMSEGAVNSSKHNNIITQW